MSNPRESMWFIAYWQEPIVCFYGPWSGVWHNYVVLPPRVKREQTR